MRVILAVAFATLVGFGAGQGGSSISTKRVPLPDIPPRLEDPNNTVASIILKCNALAFQSKPEEARGACLAGLLAYPDESELMLKLVDLDIITGRTDDADSVLGRVRPMGSIPEVSVRDAVLQAAQGVTRKDLFQTCTTGFLEARRDDWSLDSYLGGDSSPSSVCYLAWMAMATEPGNGSPEWSIVCYDQALKARPSDPLALCEKAATMLNRIKLSDLKTIEVMLLKAKQTARGEIAKAVDENLAKVRRMKS
jgi:hypothetical protein